MWGSIFSETSCFHNFTFGFPNTYSDILLHLTHWQYWFWFWFTYALVLYYILFLKLIRTRDLHFAPKLVTSYLSHGKWGDIIVCALPISWCANILSNSNFILRMIEWQNEACLFTLRIRGKQWYWVYKFEIQVTGTKHTTQKNWGHNNWITDWGLIDQQYLLFIKRQNMIVDDLFVWEQKHIDALETYYDTLLPITFTYYWEQNYWWTPQFFTLTQIMSFIQNYPFLDLRAQGHQYWTLYYDISTHLFEGPDNVLEYPKIKELQWNPKLNYLPAEYINLWSRLLKSTSMYHVVRVVKQNGTNLKVLYPEISSTQPKPQTICNYLVLKQKRLGFMNMYREKPTLLPINMTAFETVDTEEDGIEVTIMRNNYHNFAVKPRSSGVRFHRLLRTRRILVLPAHVNIGLITNSFDVIHSWFIPGLGIKLDCVPGRSTHHTIYINHVGFYYGQCAEICGRYHHHMPIRVCALPFNHFIIWWYNYGSPYFYTADKKRRPTYVLHGLVKYNW